MNSKGKIFLLSLLAILLVGGGVGLSIGIKQAQDVIAKNKTSNEQNSSNSQTISSNSTNSTSESKSEERTIAQKVVLSSETLSIASGGLAGTGGTASISATVYPTTAINKTVQWTLGGLGAGSLMLSTVSGGTLATTVTSDSGETIYLTCISYSSVPCNLYCTSTENELATATCVVSFHKVLS